MLTIEELIAFETAKAKECKAQADFGWDCFTHKKLSYLEQRRNAFCAERHNQIAELLRELVERRKAPEIVHCKDCVSYHDTIDKETGCLLGIYVCDLFEDEPPADWYCADAERRTDGKTT